MTLWHVHFDRDPIPWGHICDLHRAFGQRLPCPDADASGDCAHVQTVPCTCPDPKPTCAACDNDPDGRIAAECAA